MRWWLTHDSGYFSRIRCQYSTDEGSVPKVQYNCPVSSQRTPDATIKFGISIPKVGHRPAWENLYCVRRPLHWLDGSNLAIIREGYICMRGPTELILHIRCTGGDIFGWRTTVWFTRIQVILGWLGRKKANVISALPLKQWPSGTGCTNSENNVDWLYRWIWSLTPRPGGTGNDDP